MTRYAVAVALPGLMFAMGACSTAPPKLLPPPVAPLVSPLPRKMSSRVPVADRTPNPVGLTCEPDAAPRFDDPNNPNAITNKACGYVGGNGNARSSDPWIDDQLRPTRGEPAIGADRCAVLTYEQCHGIQDPPTGSRPEEPPGPPAASTTSSTAATATATSVPTSSPPAETTSGSPTDSRSPATTGSPTASGAPTTSGPAPTTTGQPAAG